MKKFLGILACALIPFFLGAMETEENDALSAEVLSGMGHNNPFVDRCSFEQHYSGRVFDEDVVGALGDDFERFVSQGYLSIFIDMFAPDDTSSAAQNRSEVNTFINKIVDCAGNRNEWYQVPQATRTLVVAILVQHPAMLLRAEVRSALKRAYKKMLRETNLCKEKMVIEKTITAESALSSERNALTIVARMLVFVARLISYDEVLPLVNNLRRK